MLKKVLLVDSERNINFKEIDTDQDFSKLLNGPIETICIKPVARSICIAVGNGVDLFKSLEIVLDGEEFIVYIVENNDGKGIEGANLLSITDEEVEYFNKFKEKVLHWN